MKKSILVVDNHNECKQALVELIAKQKWTIQIFTAASCDEASQLIKNYLPLVVIVDIYLTNCVDIINLILEISPKTKIIFVSMFPKYYFIKQYNHYKIEHFMLKDDIPKKLIPLLKKLML